MKIRIDESLRNFDVAGLGDRAKVEIWEFGALFVSVEDRHILPF